MGERFRRIKNDFVFLIQFSVDDFKTKYSGSILGGIWAFLQPMITIVLYWFVFQLGFKTQPVGEYPFILWLMSGLVPWFFISEGVVNATTSLADYSYLVKKVLFNVYILPLAKIVSVLFVQLALIFFTFICFGIGGYYPSVYYLQIIPYLLYMILLATGVSYITATLYVFFKDVIQIVSIFTQIIFWLTPIVWPISNMPDIVQKILVFNPVYYVIEGYRNAFLNHTFGDVLSVMTVYYWAIAFVIFALGALLFKKCKNHFADVL